MACRRSRLLARLMTSSLILAGLPLAGCGEDTSPKPDAATTADAAADTAVDAAEDTAGTDATADTQAPVGDEAAQKALLAVPEKEAWVLPGLLDEVHVVRTEGDVPHIYAKNRTDLARVSGFVMARHRYFQMELARRLGLGTLSGLLGDAALGKDQESRGIGQTQVADGLLARLSDEHGVILDAFAAGVNDYIAQVVAGKLPEPSEIAIAKGLLGGNAQKLMQPWDRRSITGVMGVIVYNLGYETDDVGRTQTAAVLPGLFSGKALADLRQAGVLADIWKRVAPIDPFSSAQGLGLDTEAAPPPPPPPGAGSPGKSPGKSQAKSQAKYDAKAFPKALPEALYQRVTRRFAKWHASRGHDKQAGFGSNSWAVRGSAAVDGRALLAGDGHLPLSVPSLFYQIGFDTAVFGGGETHQMGLVIPGMPFMAVGTNGRVAWSQTQLVGDINDWYRDELVLDAQGLPKATIFEGKEMPVSAVEETYVVADVPALGSKGRTEKWTRWQTWDGRLILDIEGRDAKADEKLAAGEALVNLKGDLVVPGDQDGDKKVTAITQDYTGWDDLDVLRAIDGFGHAQDVHGFREATKGLVAYSQNIVAADVEGNVLYTGYQAVPCRGYLPREADGTWKPGADPKLLLDGTKYKGFTIPVQAGVVDEAPGKTDPYKCVVPFAEYPQSINPKSGFVITANNDPGNLSTDNSLINDKWYIGGPWANGYRAGTIAADLTAAIAAGKADTAAMSAAQANHRSRLGGELGPALVEAIGAARLAFQASPTDADDKRLADLYAADAKGFDEVETRLKAWLQAGTPAASGVETFYHTPTAAELDHAVATMIFNAWMGRFVAAVFDDEGLPGVWEPWSNDAKTRSLSLLVAGRGPNNPKAIGSWNPATQESAFFDVLATPEVERSREVMLGALAAGLKWLRGKQAGAGEGGFGTEDMAKWLWGLRHGVHFDSILGEFLGSDPTYAALTEQFSITPDLLPLMPKLTKGDPRIGLTLFPRPGDAFAVDAAGGIGQTGFGYGSGPVFRMVVALGKDAAGKPKVDGVNVLPGGQSGLTDSPFFADQARLWLGNQAMPLRFHPADVVAGAVGREVFRPK